MVAGAGSTPPLAPIEHLINGAVNTSKTAMREVMTAQADVGTDPDTFAEKVVDMLAALQVNVELLATDRSNPRHIRKPLSDCRIISNMKAFGSDRSEFRVWNDRLINALSQALGSPWRKFMTNLNRALDQTRQVMTEHELNLIDGAVDISDAQRVSDELYSVLCEKTEGEALSKTMSCTHGNGMEAYQIIYLYFAGVSGLALSERMSMIMRPKPAKREEHICDQLDKWCEQERVCRDHGPDYTMNPALKINAIREIMDIKKEAFETMHREAKTLQGGKEDENMFQDLLKRVREYATLRRMDAQYRKYKGDPMDVDEVEEEEHFAEEWRYQEHWRFPDQYDESDYVADQHPYQYGPVDAVGKGWPKGKGKGKKGKGKGAFGPWDPKGKGKGSFGSFGSVGSWDMKGKGKGVRAPVSGCWTCGGPHYQSDCPHAWSKGMKGQDFKGKGKGTDQVDREGAFFQGVGAVRQEDQCQDNGIDHVCEPSPEWSVLVRKSWGPKDMRPVKSQSVTGSFQNWRQQVMLGEVTHKPKIDEVTRNVDTHIDEVIPEQGNWERIPLKLDSGAVETVIPASAGKFYPTRETEASKSGAGFRAANGSFIKHFGQKQLVGISDQWKDLGLRAQVADVRTPLASVNQIIKTGNVVHFETDNCYVQDTQTGAKTIIQERGGSFEMGLWVPKKACRPIQRVSAADQPRQSSTNSSSNRFACLAEDDETEHDMNRDISVFSRQVRNP